MTRALILAYYFPPIGGAGAQRPAKFVRYLPSVGVEPIVITGPGDSVGRWTPTDDSLAAEIDPETSVHRIAGPEPSGSKGWRGRSERWLGLRAPWSRWWVEGTVELGKAMNDVDLIYAWMSPYESAEAASRLSVALGKPWVADLGDPWALDEMMVFPSAVHRQAELRRMRRLLSSAAAIVMSTPEAAARVRTKFPELAGRPIVAIPNGFDAFDFVGPPPERADDAFRIVHTGYLHTELGLRQRRTAPIRRLLGGEPHSVDIMTRSHVFLLRAISKLAEKEPELAERLEVHLAGVLSNADREIADRFRGVRTHGYLPHSEAIQLIRSADLLFLPMQNLPSGVRSSTVPGKTYEYVASGRPILAAVPEGDAKDIVVAAGGDVCGPDDVDRMAGIIRERLADTNGGRRAQEDQQRFEYQRLTSSLAELFERVVAIHRAPQRISGRDDGRLFGGADKTPKKVAHLAYFFPPIGGAGAQRTLKFVRYLPTFDYDSVVVTGVGDSTGRWTPADETLNVEVGAGTKVLRVAGPEPPQALGWKGRAERWLALPSEWTNWWLRGVAALASELEDVDVILASMSPYESAEAAEYLSRRLGKPWVAGLRDPWALDEMMVFPTAWHRRRELRRMQRLLRSAAAVIMTTAESVARIRETFPELAGKPIISIPNGFDASDFELPVPPRNDGVFRIVHTGYLHTELGLRQRRTERARQLLGGQTVGVDILTRSHVYLLEAVKDVLARDPSLAGRIEIHLAGVLSSADREAIAESGIVRVHGYLAHAEALELIRTADLLFLPMQNLPPGTRSTTVPGKTYEYLAAGRPILAAVPAGDARDLVAAAGNSWVVEPNDTRGMTKAINAELERWRVGESPASTLADLLSRYERRHLTWELASVLDAVTGLPTPGPSQSTAAAVAREYVTA